MASLNWSLFVAGSGDSFASSSEIFIPRPNDDIPINLRSTEKEVILVDGSKAFVAPETKTQKEAIVFKWEWQLHAFVTQLRVYMTNYDYIKITTHQSGEEYIGRFVSVEHEWIVGTNPDRFDLKVIFRIQA